MLTKMSGQKIGTATKNKVIFDLLRVEVDNGPAIVALIDVAKSEKGPGGRLFKVTHTDAHHAEKVYTEAGYSVELDEEPEPPKSDEVQELESSLKAAGERIGQLEGVVKDLREDNAKQADEIKALKAKIEDLTKKEAAAAN